MIIRRLGFCYLGFFSPRPVFSVLLLSRLLDPELAGCFTAGCLLDCLLTSGRVFAGLVLGFDGVALSRAGLVDSVLPGFVEGLDAFSRGGLFVTGRVVVDLELFALLTTGLPVLSKDGNLFLFLATVGLFFLKVL